MIGAPVRTCHCIAVVSTDGRRPLRVVVDAVIEVGRECDGLVVLDPMVSRRHLEMWCVDGRLVVADLHSANGTWLDGELVEGPVWVEPGSTVRIGTTSITVGGGLNSGLNGDLTVSRSCGGDGCR